MWQKGKGISRIAEQCRMYDMRELASHLHPKKSPTPQLNEPRPHKPHRIRAAVASTSLPRTTRSARLESGAWRPSEGKAVGAQWGLYMLVSPCVIEWFAALEKWMPFGSSSCLSELDEGFDCFGCNFGTGFFEQCCKL